MIVLMTTRSFIMKWDVLVPPSTNHHPRPRLIILLLLVTGVLSVLYYLYNSSFNPAHVLLGVSILCLPFLVAMEGFFVVSGRVRKRELPLVLVLESRLPSYQPYSIRH